MIEEDAGYGGFILARGRPDPYFPAGCQGVVLEVRPGSDGTLRNGIMRVATDVGLWWANTRDPVIVAEGSHPPVRFSRRER